jgi:hypothetical protein
MKSQKTAIDVVLEIESVNRDIIQLTARLNSGKLSNEQKDLNARFLLGALQQKQKLSSLVKVKPGTNVTIVNANQAI